MKIKNLNNILVCFQLMAKNLTTCIQTCLICPTFLKGMGINVCKILIMYLFFHSCLDCKHYGYLWYKYKVRMNTKPNINYINLFKGRKMEWPKYCICKNNNNGQCKMKLQISLVASLNLPYHFCLALLQC